MFLGGLAVVVLATESGIGSYDDVLFWDQMVLAPDADHGRPAAAHRRPADHAAAAREPEPAAHVGQADRRGPGWPSFLHLAGCSACAAYAATVIAAHLTDLANLVETKQTLHDAKHVLFLVVGYLFFLPILGREPIRWRLSYPVRFVILVADHAGGHIHRSRARLRQPRHARGSRRPAARLGARGRGGPARRRGRDCGSPATPSCSG